MDTLRVFSMQNLKSIIPKMQSLPQIAKDILMKRENPHIDYTNQMLIINPDGRADSWVPSSSDVFAEGWGMDGLTPLHRTQLVCRNSAPK